jgi:hypothetical protein
MDDEGPVDDDARRQASAAEFRAFLEETGQSRCGFARTLKRIGDSRKRETIERHVQLMSTGKALISGEMRVIMAIFRKSHRKRLAQAAQAARAAPEKSGEPFDRVLPPP